MKLSIGALASAMGVTRIADITGLDYIGIPTCAAIVPNARSLSVNQGKGLTRAEARRGALMEAAERFHAEHVDKDLKLATASEMGARHRIAAPARLPMAANSSHHSGLRMLWIEGEDLLARGAPTWVPFELVHCDYTLPTTDGAGAFQATSTGLAAGKSLAHAIAGGLAEVIERDAIALFRASPSAERDRRRLRLDDIADPACRNLLARYAQAAIAVRAWNVTSDVAVPAFLVEIDEAPGNKRAHLGAFHGAGAHPARAIALQRALIEAAQSRVTTIAGARDDLGDDMYLSPRRRCPAAAAPCRFRDIPNLDARTPTSAVRHVLRCLSRAGFDSAIAVDLTRDEFRVPVVRIVIPGMEGMLTRANCPPGPRARARWRMR